LTGAAAGVVPAGVLAGLGPLAVEVEVAPGPVLAVEVEPGPVLAGLAEPAAVTVSRLAVTGAAVPRPGSRGMAPGRGPGA
jgi:hypothetical protein